MILFSAMIQGGQIFIESSNRVFESALPVHILILLATPRVFCKNRRNNPVEILALGATVTVTGCAAAPWLKF
jgi:hypothetical protein